MYTETQATPQAAINQFSLMLQSDEALQSKFRAAYPQLAMSLISGDWEASRRDDDDDRKCLPIGTCSVCEDHCYIDIDTPPG